MNEKIAPKTNGNYFVIPLNVIDEKSTKSFSKDKNDKDEESRTIEPKPIAVAPKVGIDNLQSYGWVEGSLEFYRPKVSKKAEMSARPHRTEDDHDHLTVAERRRSFPPRASEILFPEPDMPGKDPSVSNPHTPSQIKFSRRFSIIPQPKEKIFEVSPEKTKETNESEGPKFPLAFTINSAELLVYTGSINFQKIGGYPAALIVHYDLKSPDSPTRFLDPYLRALFLTQYIREFGKRVDLACYLDHVLFGADDLLNSGVKEYSDTSIFSVTTALELHEDVDDELLAARALATVTTSKSHGSGHAKAARLARTRDDVIKLSDSQHVISTSRGLCFLTPSSQSERYELGPHYISVMYSNAVAMCVIADTIAVLFRASVGQLIYLMSESTIDHSNSDVDDFQRLLEQFAILNQQVLLYESSISRYYLECSRIYQKITDSLNDQLRISSKNLNFQSDIAQTQKSLNILYKSEERKKQIASYTDIQKASRERENTNNLITILTAVTVPLSIVYPVYDHFIVKNSVQSPLWFVILTFLGICFGAIMVEAFKRRK